MQQRQQRAAQAVAAAAGGRGGRLVRQQWALQRPCRQGHMWCVAAAAAAVGVAAPAALAADATCRVGCLGTPLQR